MPVIKPEINIRQQQIIRAILSSNGKTTLSLLAETTGLSPRIVRYNMEKVETWLKYSDVELINKPGIGIEVFESRKRKSELLQELKDIKDSEIVFTPEQRKRIILLYLLQSIGAISAQEISELEGFSRSTLFSDIRAIEEWLQQFNISLARKSARGMWIEGTEDSRRFALSRVLRDELGDKNWYQLPQKHFELSSLQTFIVSKRFQQFLVSLELDEARKLFIVIQKWVASPISISSQAEIIVYLALMIDAIQSGRFVHVNTLDEKSKTEEYSVAKIVCRQIEESFSIQIPTQEIDLIAAMIASGKNEIVDSDENFNQGKSIPPERIQKISDDIINICSMRLHPMLKIDAILQRELTNHLEYAIFRLKHHIPIRNTDLEIITDTYEQVYKVAESSIFIIEEAIGIPIPNEEIGYISMYLLSALERLRTVEDKRLKAIIANDGIRSKASLLKSRVEFEFPTINISETLNTYNLSGVDLSEVELIISTIQIDDPPIPVIEVSPFLESDDVNNIQRFIREKAERERNRLLTELDPRINLVDLIITNHISFKEAATDWHNLIDFASKSLLESNSIQSKYVSAMKNLIDEHGFYMYMGNGVLLLHAKPTDGVNRLCISLLRLDYAFNLPKKSLPDVNLIFVLGAVDNNSHLTALFQLNDMIQIPDFLKSVRESISKEDVLEAFRKFQPESDNLQIFIHK